MSRRGRRDSPARKCACGVNDRVRLAQIESGRNMGAITGWTGQAGRYAAHNIDLSQERYRNSLNFNSILSSACVMYAITGDFDHESLILLMLGKSSTRRSRRRTHGLTALRILRAEVEHAVLERREIVGGVRTKKFSRMSRSRLLFASMLRPECVSDLKLASGLRMGRVTGIRWHFGWPSSFLVGRSRSCGCGISQASSKDAATCRTGR